MSFSSLVGDIDPDWQDKYTTKYEGLLAELRKLCKLVPANGLMHCEGQTSNMMSTNLYQLERRWEEGLLKAEIHLTQMWIIVKEGKAGLYHQKLSPLHLHYKWIGREETVIYFDTEDTFKLVLDGKSVHAEGVDFLGDPIDEMEAISLTGSAWCNIRKSLGHTYEIVYGTDVQGLIDKKLQVRANWLLQQEELKLKVNS